MEQLNLDAVPRKRVQIEAEVPSAEVGVAIDSWDHIGFTDWERVAPPPCAGWWDVTDHKTGSVQTRLWFDGRLWTLDASFFGRALPFTHKAFKRTYAWRGLKSPPTRRRALLTD